MESSQMQSALPLFDKERPYIKGRLVHEIFHNPENYYTVSKIKITESTENIEDRQMTVVGQYPPLLEGEIYTFWGELKHHPRFGKQYQLEHYRKEMPEGKDGLVQYLSSDLFPGIGKKLARRIVNTLGEKAIPLILENPALLEDVPQLTEQKRQTVYEKLMEYQGLEQIMVKLSEYGIGLALSVQIYQTYEERAMEVLQDNPYQLIEDVEGIGFRRADAIAQAMGIAFDAPERIRAACHFFLWEQAEQNGHVYFPFDDLLQEASKWLNQKTEDDYSHTSHEQTIIEETHIEQQVMEMGEEGKLMLDEQKVYVPSLFYAEKGFAKKVKQLLQHESDTEISQQELYAALGEMEERYGIQYAPSQKEAIEKALTTSLMILTGGPGTGKTTVIKGICEIFARLHGCSLDPKHYANKDEPFPVILIAPTGRAAKRMEESTGLPAVTIHRLLGWQGGQTFEHSEDNPIDGKLLIVDETSMMDQWLANQLFRTIPPHMQVVLVGDEDQLPSVGPGQVLRDLIASEQIPVVELTDIFRQEEGSSIIELAHHMKQGEFPSDLSTAYADRRFFSAEPQHIVDIVCQVAASAKHKGYTPKDIQVLAPMYRGEAGIDALNHALQEEFNPLEEKKREVKHRERIFRVGDKVLQLVNNPEENVFNGDIGQVEAIIYAKENVEREDQLVVSFDMTEVTYTRSEWNQLTLAYCISVHKSQGSEFPIVVLPIIRQYHRMLRRNLIYTAITRAKDYLIMCGEEQALKRAIERVDVSTRYTALCETLTEL